MKRLKYIVGLALCLAIYCFTACNPDLQPNPDIGNYNPQGISLDDNDRLLVLTRFGSSDELSLSAYNDEKVDHYLINLNGWNPTFPNYRLLQTGDYIVINESFENHVVSREGSIEIYRNTNNLISPIIRNDNKIYMGGEKVQVYELDGTNAYTLNIPQTRTLDGRYGTFSRKRIAIDTIRDIVYINIVARWESDSTNSLVNTINFYEGDSLYSYTTVNKAIREIGEDIYPINIHYNNDRLYIALMDLAGNLSYMVWDTQNDVKLYYSNLDIRTDDLLTETYFCQTEDKVYFSQCDGTIQSNPYAQLISFTSSIYELNQHGYKVYYEVNKSDEFSDLYIPYYIDKSGRICGRFIKKGHVPYSPPGYLGRMSPAGTFFPYVEDAIITNPKPISEYFESLK